MPFLLQNVSLRPRTGPRSLALLALLATATLSCPPVLAQTGELLAAAPAKAASRPGAEPVDLQMMAKIREEGMDRSQLPQTMAYLTDVIGPRLTASPGLQRANKWTVDKLTQWGISNARLEPWGPFGRGWTLERFSAQAVSPVCIPLIAYPKAWSPGWKGVKTAEVVYFDPASEADLEKFKGKLKGKFVLTAPLREVTARFERPDGRRWTEEELKGMADAVARPRGEGEGRPRGGRPGGQGNPQNFSFARKRLQFLLQEGAGLLLDPARGDVGTVFVQQASVIPPADAEPGRRLSPWSKESEKQILPQVAVSVEHYNRLVRLVQAGEKVQLAIELQTRFNDTPHAEVDNVIAEIPGTDKAEEIVMCGAHIDSWQSGTGATDNAAGVVVCMEAMRILKALGVQPRRTIRIGLWSGEEQGLFGSRAYVARHIGTPTEPRPGLEKFSAYFNLDNGTGRIRGVYCQGNEAVMPIFSDWLQPFADLDATTVTIRNTGSTDHVPFDAAGIPGFQFIQDPVEYSTRTHHSNQDVYDRIQVNDMKQAAIVMAAFLYNAAMREDKLPRK